MQRLAASETALLLIDVQNFVLEPCNHPARPEFYERVWAIVGPTLERLLSHCRAEGVEVVYTVMENLTADGRDRSLDYKLSGFNIAKGSTGAAIPAPFQPRGDEIIFRKSSACLWHSTNAAYVLRNIGIRNVVCTGFLTDQCVEQTLRAGTSLGYRMACVPDACAANTNARHRSALARVKNVCQFMSADEFCAPPQTQPARSKLECPH
jgi:nicotinamidase-related amidase